MKISEKLLRGIISESIKRNLSESFEDFDPNVEINDVDDDVEIITPEKKSPEERKFDDLKKALEDKSYYKELKPDVKLMYRKIVSHPEITKKNPNASLQDIYQMILDKEERQRARENSAGFEDMFDYSEIFESKLNKIVKESIDKCIGGACVDEEIEEGWKNKAKAGSARYLISR